MLQTPEKVPLAHPQHSLKSAHANPKTFPHDQDRQLKMLRLGVSLFLKVERGMWEYYDMLVTLRNTSNLLLPEGEVWDSLHETVKKK